AGTIDGDTTICAGITPNKLRPTASTTGGVGSYTYQWQVSTDSLNWTDISGETSMSYQPGAIQGNNWFRRLDSDGNSCGPDTSNVLKLAIFAQPKAGFTANAACQGKQTLFTDTTELAFGKITSYAWSFGDQGTSNQQNPINVYKNSGSYTVTLSIVADGGCNSSITKTVAVNTVPSVDFVTTTECEGTATDFTNKSSISSGTLSYAWDLGDNNSSTATEPNHTYTNAGYYNVQLTATSSEGCVDSVMRTVQVKRVAQPNFSATAVCEGLSTSFTNLSTNASTYSWDFGNSSGSSTKENPTYKYASSGSYTAILTATSADGCSDTIHKQVSVYALPTASFSATEVCLGETTDFTNSSSGASNYQWVFGNGTSSNKFEPGIIYGSAGDYDVELTVTTTNGCTDNITNTVTVNALPSVSFTTADICLSEDLATINNTTGASSYAWTFGDGSGSSTTAPTHTYSANGNYEVKLVATSADGCIDSASTNINAFAVPDVSFTAANVCDGNDVVFNNTSKIAAGTMTYVWDLGNGASTGNPAPSYQYGSDGNYTVKLVATSNNGCQDSSTSSVTVYAMPIVDFSAPNVCYGDTMFTTNNTSGAASYVWSFDDGNSSTDVSPFNFYASSDDYNVQLIATTSNNCVDSVSKAVSIYAKPIAGFDAKDVCDETAVSFANNSYNASIVAHNWSFGDGNSSAVINPSYTYAGNGSYDVTLITISDNSCSDTITNTIVVHPNPVVAFANTTECDYDSTEFTNNTTIASGTISYEWNFGTGDVSSSEHPAYLFPQAGAYVVGLEATSDMGCVRSTSATVVVNPAPMAAIELENNCEGLVSEFASASSVSTGSLVDYNWNFDDGNTASFENPTHLYAFDGDYDITLIITTDQACTDTVTTGLVVYNKPEADFSTPDVCFGKLSAFTDASVDAQDYTYDFGDKWGISILSEPEYTYEEPGTYNPTLYVTSSNGCRDTVTKTVVIYELPVARFGVNNHCFGEDFTPTDNSVGTVTDWNWDYDNGDSETGIDPIYTYSKDGDYNVRLIVTDVNGCIDSTRRMVTVWPLPDVWVRSDTMVSRGYTVQLEARGGV
ncbi:MAG: PKD domain-containing protein, partial [Bacteroidia bacterium]